MSLPVLTSQMLKVAGYLVVGVLPSAKLFVSQCVITVGLMYSVDHDYASFCQIFRVNTLHPEPY